MSLPAFVPPRNDDSGSHATTPLVARNDVEFLIRTTTPPSNSFF
ncbi:MULTISPECIES: hypothetical protein [unclassified Rickettsia]